MTDIGQARVGLADRRNDIRCLRNLGEAILITETCDLAALPKVSDYDEVELLNAVVEYLDAAVDCKGEQSDLQQAALVADRGALAATNIRNKADLDQLLFVDACVLAGSVSLLLMSSPAAAIPHMERELIKAAAHRLLISADERAARSDASFTVAHIWALRVAADALDNCLDQTGRELLKATRRFPGPHTKQEKYLRQKLRREPAGMSLTPDRLAYYGKNLAQSESMKPTARALPLTSATSPDRHLLGRGPLRIHARRTRWRMRQFFIFPFALLIPALIVLFLFRSKDWLAGNLSSFDFSPLALRITDEQVFSGCQQLLAVGATVTVALAIGTRVQDDERWGAMYRWWHVGFVVVLLCGWISTTSVVFLLVASKPPSWTLFGLSLALSLLTCALALGIDVMEEDRHLEGARLRHELEIMQHELEEASRRDGHFLTRNVSRRHDLLSISLFCTLPGFFFGVFFIGQAVFFGRELTLLQACLLPFAGASIFGLPTATTSAWAVETVASRYNRKTRIAALSESVPLLLMTLVVLTIHLYALLIVLYTPGRPLIQKAVVGVAWTLTSLIPLILVIGSTVSPRFAPHSIRRIGHRRASREVQRMRDAVGNLSLSNID